VRPLNFTVRFRMHQAPTFLLAALVALGSNGVSAQTKTTVLIHFASGDTCVVADSHVPCREVGAKLRELGIPQDADLRFSPDTYVSYEAVRAMMDSIQRAGYKVEKVGFITSPR
jgi:biopolymer transport protein ExbD